MRKLFVIIMICGLLLTGCNSAETEVNRPMIQKTYFDNGMQKFPSYDLGSEDVHTLAAVAANSCGTDKDKQEAIIFVLDQVWYNSNLSLCDWVYRNYELYNEPTEHDYMLVNMVIFGEWAE